LREIRQELGLLAALVLVAVVSARIFGSDRLLLATSVAIYLGWHVLNLGRLIYWLGRVGVRTPISFGIWEWIFNRLQAIELRGRKRRRELRDFIRRLRLVVNGIADAVVLLDERARIRWFNPAAKRLLGLTLHSATKRSIAEFLGHSHFTDRLTETGNFGPVDIPSPVNGAVILRVEISELDGTGQRLLIARDVTKTHNMERSRKDFVANVSHELRTPLTVFRSYLETLADDIDRLPDLAEPIEQLTEQSMRMQGLVQDLLNLSRLESTERASLGTPVAVPGMIRSIVEEALLIDEAEEHEIIQNVDSRLLLTGDAGILRMAFSNLVFNAVRHTGAGSRVVVDWARNEDDAVFRVRDNGPGIAVHHLPRLTERFYRVDASRSRADGGTGLGLAIVKHALERHDASLQIESAPGQGACFTCHFPSVRVVWAEDREPLRREPARRRLSVLQ
jgi:two-component system phosphate regulon sensor histidine kinase PhoR